MGRTHKQCEFSHWFKREVFLPINIKMSFSRFWYMIVGIFQQERLRPYFFSGFLAMISMIELSLNPHFWHIRWLFWLLRAALHLHVSRIRLFIIKFISFRMQEMLFFFIMLCWYHHKNSFTFVLCYRSIHSSILRLTLLACYPTLSFFPLACSAQLVDGQIHHFHLPFHLSGHL